MPLYLGRRQQRELALLCLLVLSAATAYTKTPTEHAKSDDTDNNGNNSHVHTPLAVRALIAVRSEHTAGVVADAESGGVARPVVIASAIRVTITLRAEPEIIANASTDIGVAFTMEAVASACYVTRILAKQCAISAIKTVEATAFSFLSANSVLTASGIRHAIGFARRAIISLSCVANTSYYSLSIQASKLKRTSDAFAIFSTSRGIDLLISRFVVDKEESVIVLNEVIQQA